MALTFLSPPLFSCRTFYPPLQDSLGTLSAMCTIAFLLSTRAHYDVTLVVGREGRHFQVKPGNHVA